MYTYRERYTYIYTCICIHVYIYIYMNDRLAIARDSDGVFVTPLGAIPCYKFKLALPECRMML